MMSSTSMHVIHVDHHVNTVSGTEAGYHVKILFIIHAESQLKYKCFILRKNAVLSYMIVGGAVDFVLSVIILLLCFVY